MTAAVAALTVAGAVVNVASVWVNYGSSWRWVKEVPSEEVSRRQDFIHSLDHGPIAYTCSTWTTTSGPGP